MDYGKSISNGIKFSLQPKRWGQVFIIDLIFILAGLSFMLPNIPMLRSMMNAGMQGTAGLGQLLLIGGSLLVLFAVWILIRMYASISLIRQSVKQKDNIGKSWSFAKTRFWPFLALSIVVGIISTIASLVPLIGWLLSLLVSIVFFFAAPAVVVKGMSFDNGMRDSYNKFRSRTGDVIISWLLIMIISVIIFLVFSIPAIIAFALVFLPGLQAGQSFSSVVAQFMVAWPVWIPVGIILLIGIGVSTVFSLYATTNLYLQLNSKKLIKLS